MGDKGNADMLLAYEYSNLNITSQIKDKYWFVIDIYPGLCVHVRIFGNKTVSTYYNIFSYNRKYMITSLPAV